MGKGRKQQKQEDTLQPDFCSIEDFVNAIIYSNFEEWVEECSSHSEEKREAVREIVSRFAEIHGASENSGLVMMFRGFCGGFEKGFDFSLRLGKAGS